MTLQSDYHRQGPMAAWSAQQRSRYARIGWETRRRRRSALGRAQRRFWLLLRILEASTLRLYACEVAERVLHHYAAAYPGDSRPAVALEVARRYARGQAGEAERLAAWRLLHFVAQRSSDELGDSHPAHAAANAAGFTLWRPAHRAAYWSLFWATTADGGAGDGLAHLVRHGVMLEVLTRVRA